MAGFHTRMRGRDTGESHRSASPLELFFDLTFVVAIGQVAGQLAHGIEAGHTLEALIPFGMIFFAIWWAWMNFTWFASAYDTDDVLYRVLTFVQVGGALVIAAGVPYAFMSGDFAVITLGYLVMRVGLVGMWVRAAVEHKDGRSTAVRYAIGISVVQALWVSLLFVPDHGTPWAFLALAILELAVPVWAERTGDTSWHPHHIAERFGLFVIIVLGEGSFATTLAVQAAVSDRGVSTELVLVAAAGLVLSFALWWLYFAQPAGEGLERNRQRSFLWGYGHIGIFASIAAIGAGLEVTVRGLGGHIEASPYAVAYAIAIPVAVFLVLLWALNATLVARVVVNPIGIAVTVVFVLLIPLAALGVVATIVIIALAVVGLLVFALVMGVRSTTNEGIEPRPTEA
jgi:low temperature requirement protein LtrA